MWNIFRPSLPLVLSEGYLLHLMLRTCSKRMEQIRSCLIGLKQTAFSRNLFWAVRFRSVFAQSGPELEKLEEIDEVWVCCVRAPKPGWRLFGRFIAQDCLVLMLAHDRHDLAPRPKYQAVAENAIAEWNRVLPNVSPYSASKLSGYISGVVKNADED